MDHKNHIRAAAAADPWSERSQSRCTFSRPASPCPIVSVTTDTTEQQDTTPLAGWIFYDGDCAICTGLAGRFGGTLRRAGFCLVAFQHPWAAAQLGLRPGEVPNAARVVTACGATFEGAGAMLLLAGHVWWARPLAWLGRWRPALRAMRRAYKWFAARRHCIGGVCALPQPRPTAAPKVSLRRREMR